MPHLSKFVTAAHVVPTVRRLLPGGTDRQVALACVNVLEIVLKQEVSNRAAGPTAHQEHMVEVSTMRRFLPLNITWVCTHAIGSQPRGGCMLIVTADLLPGHRSCGLLNHTSMAAAATQGCWNMCATCCSPLCLQRVNL